METSAVTTAMTTVANDVMGIAGDVAPLAAGVFGILIAWRIGKKIFSSVAS